mgnify:CR=1 FL=1
MNFFQISIKPEFGQLLEEVLVENTGSNIEEVYEEPEKWIIIASTNKTEKELVDIISEYIERKDFIIC